MSDSWHKGNSAPSTRSPVVIEERTRSGYWFGSLLCVFIQCFRHCWLDDRKNIWPAKTCATCLQRKKWRKITGTVRVESSREDGDDDDSNDVYGCVVCDVKRAVFSRTALRQRAVGCQRCGKVCQSITCQSWRCHDWSECYAQSEARWAHSAKMCLRDRCCICHCDAAVSFCCSIFVGCYLTNIWF